MAATTLSWAEGQSDKTFRLEAAERWRECLEECDRGIERLADAEDLVLMQIRARLKTRRIKCGVALRRAGEEVPAAPWAQKEKTVKETTDPRPQTEDQEPAAAPTGVVLRKCTSCEDELPLSEFAPHPHSKDGLAKQCRACISELRKAAKARQFAGRAPKLAGPETPAAPKEAPEPALAPLRSAAAQAVLACLTVDALGYRIGACVRNLAMVDGESERALCGMAADTVRLLAELGHADLVAGALATALDELARGSAA